MIADAGETSLTTKNELKQRERHLQVEEAISRSHVACCNDAKFVMSQSDANYETCSCEAPPGIPLDKAPCAKHTAGIAPTPAVQPEEL